MREPFIKNTFVNMFYFINETQSLTRKVSAVKKKCAVDSAKFPQLHKWFIASSKLCQNLCSLKWLKPTRNPLRYVHWVSYLLQV